VKKLLKSDSICESYAQMKKSQFFDSQCTCASSVMILKQRRWQSPGRQHGKSVDGLFEKVIFGMAFEGVESE